MKRNKPQHAGPLGKHGGTRLCPSMYCTAPLPRGRGSPLSHGAQRPQLPSPQTQESLAWNPKSSHPEGRGNSMCLTPMSDSNWAPQKVLDLLLWIPISCSSPAPQLASGLPRFPLQCPAVPESSVQWSFRPVLCPKLCPLPRPGSKMPPPTPRAPGSILCPAAPLSSKNVPDSLSTHCLCLEGST